MIHNCFSTNRFSRLRQWPWLCGLLSLLLVRAALGTDAGYTNNAYVFFDGLAGDTMPSDFNPMIDAANFVNNDTFIIANSSLYQTQNTTNYVNTRLMQGLNGFWFDRHTANPVMDTWASGFNNSGEIDCLYTLKVWATNLVSHGTLRVLDPTAQFGMMELSGNNVDLSRSTITMSGNSQYAGQIFGFSPTVGGITNYWSPAFNFTLPDPMTPPFQVPPVPVKSSFQLVNAVVYANDTGVVNTNRVVQVVFISQPNPTIVNNVSFDPAPDTGNITVQFSGTYVDPVTALLVTNYLSVQDNFGERTNLQVAGSTPVNYRIFESQSIFNPPPPAGLPDGIFGNVLITNVFSYGIIELAATTASTNNVANRSITNLPGRIQITANGNLDLTLANISGANYMSLTATNLTATNNVGYGAPLQIISPFADIHLGVTNGFLAITNLMVPFIPVWNGTMTLWSARWQIIDAGGVTNSFHVLFVDAPALSAAASAQVQDLVLHGTNSVVISDVINVMRTLSIDAQNLTLTTNGFGHGTASPDGELNLEANSILWPGAMPNVRNLTNNGAIRIQNLAQFVGASNGLVAIPTAPAVAATGTLSQVGANNVANTNQVTIGSYTYTFVNTLVAGTNKQVKIAATFDGSMSNLFAAINGTNGSGTKYSANMTPNTAVTAADWLTNHSFTVTSKAVGLTGNSIPTTLSPATTNLTWGQATLSGGLNTVAGSTNLVSFSVPYDNFINRGLISDQGATTIFANYFENSGTFTNNSLNGLGSFILQSTNTKLIHGSIIAGGDVSITTGVLVASNLALLADGSLTLRVTNQLTDTGVTNGNIWFVGGESLVGLNLPLLPNSGDLLGTTIFCSSPVPNKEVVNTWAGQDIWAGQVRVASVNGYTNNAAVGRLILDGLAVSSAFKFQGAGTNNALYVDYLELRDQATNRDSSGNFNALNIISNNSSCMTIYYAQAVMNGHSIAEHMNFKNGGRLRWVTNYAGFFSSAGVIYTNANGTTMTNFFNAALAQSPDIDSDSDGIFNGNDSAPFGVPPLITRQPVNVTTNAGGNVTFSITVSNISTLPLSYQWYFNAGALPNKTNAILTLTGVTNSDAGTYSVTVMNVAGSTVSTNAILTVNPSILSGGQLNFTIATTNLPVPPAPQGQMIANASSPTSSVLAAVLKWQTITNATNFVFYKTNFTMTNWLPLTNFITPAATSSPVTVTVSEPATNKMRAYRVRVDVKK